MTSATTRRDAANERVGAQLRDKWRLERLLGVGGMGAVYEARHRNGSRAAIKVLHDHLAVCAAETERFRREAYIANRVDHPAVVRVLDDDESDGVRFLVMELVEGQPLDALVSGPLASSELIDVAEQVLDALVVAHARGVVHRDIKPQNLLLDRDRRLRILDFGIARVMDDPATDGGEQGSILGTLEYMAPEQLRGEPGCARSDIYALGATLFALGSGQPLHQATCTIQHIRRVLGERGRPFASVAPSVVEDLAALIDRATRPSKDERWPNAECMQREVRRVRSTLPPPVWDLGRSARSEEPTKRMRTPPPAPVDPVLLLAARSAAEPLRADRPRRRETRVVLAALAALAVLAVLLLLFGRLRA